MLPSESLRASAEIMQKLNPNRHQSEAVQSSVRRHERKTGEHLQKPIDKTANHLGRISMLSEQERVLERYRTHVLDSMLLQYDDVSDSYWQAWEQRNRDNGQGAKVLDEEEKRNTVDGDRNFQANSLMPWFTTLSDQQAGYPLWFQMYALEGVARLGKLQKKTNGDQLEYSYSRRRKDSAMPFPKCSPDALHKVYETVEAAYGDQQADKNEAYNGSFNRLYAQTVMEDKFVVEMPDHPQDVIGEWRVYDRDSKDELLEASSENWCIVDETWAKYYLHNSNQFYFFHLQDSESGDTAQVASASIRMKRDKGRRLVVDEVSGATNGSRQELDEVLEPLVLQKVLSLPGGEAYLQREYDKQMLMTLDQKQQAGEEFTCEELDFLYEIDHTISLRFYHDEDPTERDPRARELKVDRVRHVDILREQYGDMAEFLVMDRTEMAEHAYEALMAGVAPEIIVNKLRSEDIVLRIPVLFDYGVDETHILDRLNSRAVMFSFDMLLKCGVAIDTLMERLSAEELIENIDHLRESGAQISIPELIDRLDEEGQLENYFKKIMRYRSEFDINEVVKKCPPYLIAEHLDILIASGAKVDVNALIMDEHIVPYTLGLRLYSLLRHGADVYALCDRLRDNVVAKNINLLRAYGMKADDILQRLSPDDALLHLDTLMECGASEDALEQKIYSTTS